MYEDEKERDRRMSCILRVVGVKYTEGNILNEEIYTLLYDPKLRREKETIV